MYCGLALGPGRPKAAEGYHSSELAASVPSSKDSSPEAAPAPGASEERFTRDEDAPARPMGPPCRLGGQSTVSYLY